MASGLFDRPGSPGFEALCLAADLLLETIISHKSSSTHSHTLKQEGSDKNGGPQSVALGALSGNAGKHGAGAHLTL